MTAEELAKRLAADIGNGLVAQHDTGRLVVRDAIAKILIDSNSMPVSLALVVADGMLENIAKEILAADYLRPTTEEETEIAAITAGTEADKAAKDQPKPDWKERLGLR